MINAKPGTENAECFCEIDLIPKRIHCGGWLKAHDHLLINFKILNKEGENEKIDFCHILIVGIRWK